MLTGHGGPAAPMDSAGRAPPPARGVPPWEQPKPQVHGLHRPACVGTRDAGTDWQGGLRAWPALFVPSAPRLTELAVGTPRRPRALRRRLFPGPPSLCSASPVRSVPSATVTGLAWCPEAGRPAHGLHSFRGGESLERQPRDPTDDGQEPRPLGPAL